jgi:hypothetical protein
MKPIFSTTYLFIALTFLISTSVYAQNAKEDVRISPKAELMQKIGLTDVSISYGRP